MVTEFPYEKVLEIVVMFARHCECTNIPELHISKWVKLQMLCYTYFTKLKIFLKGSYLLC